MRKIFYTLFFIYFCNTVAGQDTLLLISGRQIIVSSVSLDDNTIAYRSLKKGSKLKTINPLRVFSIIYKDGNERIIYQPDTLDPLEFKVDELREFIKGEQDARKHYKNDVIKVAGVAIGAGCGLLTFYGIIGPPLYATIVGSYSPDVDKVLTFKVEGDAADALGITSGSYLNNITGKTPSPVIKKDQELKIANKTFKFGQDMNLDSTVNLINSKFSCHRVNAINDNGKIMLYKSDSPALIPVGAYREGFEKRARDYKIRSAMISGFIGFVASIITYGIILK